MSAFGRASREARLRRLELHAVEEMERVLRLLFACHYMPHEVRDVITMCCTWGASIGQDARVDVDDAPPPPPADVPVIDLVWDEDDEPTVPRLRVTK